MNSSVPTVTVIVPNYNHAKFLRERLDSILNQTFQDFELILLDDCSTDDSLPILQEYSSNSKVTHFVVNSTNGGSPFSQWRKGIELAKGKYIWLAETDDVACPGLLEELVGRLECDSSVVLAYCRTQDIDESGNRIHSDHFPPDDLDEERWRSDYTNDGLAEVRSFLGFQNTVPNASAVVFRKLDSITDLVPAGSRFAGDWLFWGRLLQRGRVSFSSTVLSYFRYHSSTSREAKADHLELMRFREFLLAVDGLARRFTGTPSPNLRDHSWIVQYWLWQYRGVPLYLFSDRSLSRRVSFAFCLNVFLRLFHRKVSRFRGGDRLHRIIISLSRTVLGDMV